MAGSAISRPVGRLSLKLRVAKFKALAELSMVKVKVLRPPRGMVLGKKLLLKPGRVVSTVKSALAGPLLPALEVKSPDVLLCVPAVLLVTFRLTIQLEFAPTLPPLRLMVVPPGGAVSVPSVQVVMALAGVAINTLAGKVSVKAKAVTPVPEAVLSMVKVRVLAEPGPMVLGEKALLKVGGGT